MNELAAKKALRVQIALDAIKLLRAKKLKAEFGSFVWLAGERENTTAPSDLKDIVSSSSKGKACHVCALGAAFVATIMKEENSCSVSEYFGEYSRAVDTDKMFKKLLEVFPLSTIEKMEIAFEGGEGWYQDVEGEIPEAVSDDCFDVYADLYKHIEDDEDRLIAIMQNVADHEGDLVVPE